MLKELCSEGYLVSDGIGRGTTYHLNKDSIVRMKTLTVPMMIILRQILKKQLKRNIAKKNYLE